MGPIYVPLFEYGRRALGDQNFPMAFLAMLTFGETLFPPPEWLKPWVLAFAAFLLIWGLLVALNRQARDARDRVAVDTRADERERDHVAALGLLQAQLNDVYGLLRKPPELGTSAQLPLALRDKAAQLSAKIIDFLINRQITTPKPIDVYSSLAKQNSAAARDKWQPEYFKSVHDHIGETSRIYNDEIKPQVAELYRRISQSGTSDSALESALNADVTKWPDDVYTIGERLRELSE